METEVRDTGQSIRECWNEEFLAKCQALVAEWAPRLGLREWRIGVKAEQSSDVDTLAEVSCTPAALAAIIFVFPPLAKKSDYWVTQCMVHELLHAKLSPGNDYLAGELKCIAEATQAESIRRAFSALNEPCIAALAHALVEAWQEKESGDAKRGKV